MLNPVVILQDLELAAQAIRKLQAAMPRIQKLVMDIKKSVADKGNSDALNADLLALLADASEDIELLAGLFPPAQPTVTPPAA